MINRPCVCVCVSVCVCIWGGKVNKKDTAHMQLQCTYPI